MKLSTILNSNRPTLSFEVFPPKQETNFAEVGAAVREIARLRPSFMSVTYGAGGSTNRATLAIAEELNRDLNVPTLAHLTCVGATRKSIAEKITAFRAAGIENIMALRGDLPTDIAEKEAVSKDFPHAVDLVRALRESGYDFCIGGACYPEVHPESADQKTDIRYLKEKVDAGCDFLT